MAKTKSRSQRWADAVAAAKAKAEEAKAALEAAVELLSDVKDVQQEYEDWKDNVTDNLQSGPMWDKLEEVTALDFDVEEVDEIISVLEEAEGVDLPLGFGRA